MDFTNNIIEIKKKYIDTLDKIKNILFYDHIFNTDDFKNIIIDIFTNILNFFYVIENNIFYYILCDESPNEKISNIIYDNIFLIKLFIKKFRFDKFPDDIAKKAIDTINGIFYNKIKFDCITNIKNFDVKKLNYNNNTLYYDTKNILNNEVFLYYEDDDELFFFTIYKNSNYKIYKNLFLYYDKYFIINNVINIITDYIKLIFSMNFIIYDDLNHLFKFDTSLKKIKNHKKIISTNA